VVFAFTDGGLWAKTSNASALRLIHNRPGADRFGVARSTLPLGERPTQFRQGDILQLPNPLSGHSEVLSNFFESFRFAAVCIDCDLCRETAPANFANGYAPKKVLFAPRVEKTGLGSAG